MKEIVISSLCTSSVLNDISIGSIDETSITLNQPTFSTAGNPAPTVNAYIGLNDTISATGSIVNDHIEGPIDVSTEGYQFKDLDVNTKTIYNWVREYKNPII